ncbi:MAG: MFS transporter [Microgenomates group bacterium]
MWKRVSIFLIILFFVLLSDAILSDWVPGYLQGVLGSPLKMGLMMAVSSMVGLFMDLIFPHVLRASGVRRLAGGAILGSLIFLLSMLSSTWWSYGLILMVGMAAWGIYYELDSFMTQQFVAGVAPRNERSSVWGVVGVVKNLAYFLGPMIGGYVAGYGDRVVVMGAGGILFVAYLIFLCMRLPRPEEVDIDFHGIHLRQELWHWVSLGKRVWPVLLISLMGGLVDATFWTTGTTIGGWFVSAYMFPFLFVGIIVAKWGIVVGKKRWAERFIFMGGLALIGLPLIKSDWWQVICVFVAGMFLAIAWPLTDAVYTDLVARARRGRKHVMGMSSAAFSLAYIIGPILAGWISGVMGVTETFVILGMMVVIVSGILLIFTPRKLKLPQNEIQNWE